MEKICSVSFYKKMREIKEQMYVCLAIVWRVSSKFEVKQIDNIICNPPGKEIQR